MLLCPPWALGKLPGIEAVGGKECCWAAHLQVGKLPEVFSELEVNFFLLRRLLGVRSKEGEKTSKVRCSG